MVWHPAGARRLHETLLEVELHQRDALEKIPWNGFREHRARLGVLLAHDEPHLRRRPAPPGAAQPLQEAGDGERRVDVEGAFQASDVNAQFECGGGADRHERIVVLHLLLGAFAVGGREVPVVDEEALWLVVHLAVLPKLLADGLAFLAGVGEDEALLAAGVLEDVADAGIRRLRRGVCGLLQDGGRGLGRRRTGLWSCGLRGLVRLRAAVVEVLHRQPPGLLAAVELRDDGAAPASGCQELPCGNGIADGGRKADASRPAARQPAEPFDEAEGLEPAVAAQQRVDFVNDDKAQVSEERGDLGVFGDHQCL